MRRLVLRFSGVFVLAANVIVISGCGSAHESEAAKQVTVRFAMLPYGDHTYAIIGIRKNWFREAGINLVYQAVKVDEVVSYLRNGTVDVASCSPGVIFAAHDSDPRIVSFVFGDIFQGYGIMASPNSGVRSFQALVASGLSPSDAVKTAIQQMRGKVFAYPSEAAVKPFIDIALSKGGLTRQDVKSLVLDDPLTVNAMRNHQADFQVGGAPSRILLEREGFRPILTSNDLARAAEASPNSPELASIFTDGWATTRDYYNKNHDTILRLSSVNFRITQFMKEHQDEALAIHMPYLSQVTGQPFSAADGKVIYNSLDPFFTFEAQNPWYNDPTTTYYFKNLNGALITNFVKEGVYKKPPPTVEDVIVADRIYNELAQLRSKCDSSFSRLEKLTLSGTQQTSFLEAKQYYQAYNYLDALQSAKAALAGN